MKVLLAYALALSIISASPALGVTPRILVDNTQSDFEKGELDGVSVTSDGEVVLAPLLRKVADVKAIRVWSMVRDDNGNIYLGTGNEGKVFKVTEDGGVSLLFDSPQIEIYSLALDRDGNIYAGASPDGVIYRLTPDGTPSTFCLTEQRYIWSMAFGPDGYLYAATGDEGKILKISPEGKAETLYSSADDNVMCLAIDRSGDIYAGTSGRGLIYRIDRSGEAMVLYEAPEKEIHTLLLGPDGALYAGAISGKGYMHTSGEESAETGTSVGGQGKPAPTGKKSALYRIDARGVVRLWETEQPLILSAVFGEGGRIVVGTGNKGLIYSVRGDGRWATLTKCPEGQPLSMLRVDGDGIYIGLGDVGRVYLLGRSLSEKGTLTSRVHDASINSRWGKVRWDADLPEGTAITISTRSGNTSDPGESWSPWSEELNNPSGSQIKSPPARFIQYRATLSTSGASAGPVLREVSIAGLQGNMAPVLSSVTVTPYRGRKGREESEGAMQEIERLEVEREIPKISRVKKGLWRVRWRASDPNKDKLTYSIFFRGVGERSWRLIKDKLRVSSYIWDTESVPDGKYILKVVASDLPSNPKDRALSSEKLSMPFLVDNTPPEVRDLSYTVSGGGKKARVKVSGIARDASSPLKGGEYSVDSDEWLVFFPEDAIFDSPEEGFSFLIEGLPPGEHTVAVRITDIADNIGVAKLTLNL